MPERRRWRRWLRWWLELAVAGLLITPIAALLVAGTVLFWQRGWLLWWVGGAALVAALAWGSLRLRRARPRRAPGAAAEPALTESDPTWTAREQAAWEDVRRLSSAADTAILADRRLMLAAARETLEVVAGHFHPGRAAPALQFTLPELLLLTERVSARLRSVLLEQVPLSHRVSVNTLVRAWGYRPLLAAGLRHGRHVYQLVRIGRMINPLQALVAELRDHFMDEMFDSLQTGVRRRIVRLWIEEVGYAAIELYSGRLRVDADTLAIAAASEGLGPAAEPAQAPGPLRLLVGGRIKAGKSTLVNALLGELGAGVDALPLTAGYSGYELRADDAPPAYLIDSPGLDSRAGIAELVEHAFACDLIIWVVPAHRPDRDLDRAALDALRARFAEDPQRKMPPIVAVASHIDRLSPVREWSPPYDVESPTGPKARSIRAALDAIAADLLVPIDAIVPMRLDSAPAYNLELLWLRLEAVLDEAHRARWVRVLRDVLGQSSWRQSWQQLAGAGRMVGWLAKD